MKIKDLIYDRLETSVSSFCKAIGVSNVTIFKVLNGHEPSLSTIKRVCRYFNVDYKDYV